VTQLLICTNYSGEDPKKRWPAKPPAGAESTLYEINARSTEACLARWPWSSPPFSLMLWVWRSEVALKLSPFQLDDLSLALRGCLEAVPLSARRFELGAQRLPWSRPPFSSTLWAWRSEVALKPFPLSARRF